MSKARLLKPLLWAGRGLRTDNADILWHNYSAVFFVAQLFSS